MDTTTREQFFAVCWNKVLTLGLGLVFVIYAALAASTFELSDSAAFFGLSVIGVVY